MGGSAPSVVVKSDHRYKIFEHSGSIRRLNRRHSTERTRSAFKVQEMGRKQEGAREHTDTHTHTASVAIFRVFRRRRHRRRPKSVLSCDNFLAALSSKLTKASGGENLPSSLRRLRSNGLLIAL